MQSNQKSRTLFNHIDHIRSSKTDDYISSLTEDEIKTFNKYVILLGLSMDMDAITNIDIISKYHQLFSNETFYKLCCDLTPAKKFVKWIKTKKLKFNGDLLQLISGHFKISKYEAQEYCRILTNGTNENGIVELIDLCKKYGKSDDEIEKMLDI